MDVGAARGVHMRSGATILTMLGVVLTLGCTSQPEPPKQQIDVVGIRSELLAIGKAEGSYLVTHSTYATIEQLQQDGLLTGGADRRGYIFDVTVNGSQGFIVTATPSDADKKDWPTLAMDQTMQITER
jgi:hypothetical protein